MKARLTTPAISTLNARTRDPHPMLGIMAVRTRIRGIMGAVLLGFLEAGMTAWGVLALYYSDLDSANLRSALAGAFSLAGGAAIFGVSLQRQRRKVILGFLGVFAVLVAWWT